MASETPPSLADELAAALAWWREAGVDQSFRDDAEGWLADVQEAEAVAGPAEPAPRKKSLAQAAAAVPPLGGDPGSWPTDLPAFRDWWLTEPSLDHGGSFPRVPPRGETGARVMLLVPMPEESDGAALLSGPNGNLLAAILGAMEIGPDKAYLAAVLPRHTPMPDWAQLAAAGLGEVLSRHIELAAPKRVIAFGRLVLPLLGHDTAQEPAATPNFNHEVTKVPVLAAPGLDRLLRSAATRASFWRRWLEWTDGEP
jgi:uracil-DNA glycosylase